MATRSGMVLYDGRWYTTQQFCNMKCAEPKRPTPTTALATTPAVKVRRSPETDTRRHWLKAYVATRDPQGHIEMIAEDDDQHRGVVTPADRDRYDAEAKRLVKWLMKSSHKFNRFGWLDKQSFEKSGVRQRVLVETPEGSNRWRRPTPDVFIGALIHQLIREGFLEKHQDSRGPFYIVRGY